MWIPSGTNWPLILSITDEHTKHAATAVIQNDNIQEIVHTLGNNWFNHFGFPKEIFFKKGKVETSPLSQAINHLTGSTPNDVPKCRSQDKTFNTETQTQWRENQNQMSCEEFVNAINFFHHTKGAGPATEANTTGQPQQADQKEGINDVVNNTVEPNQQYQCKRANWCKRKDVRICCHKLQRTAAQKDGQLEKQICTKIGTSNSNQKSMSRPMNRSGTNYETQNNGATHKWRSWS